MNVPNVTNHDLMKALEGLAGKVDSMDSRIVILDNRMSILERRTEDSLQNLHDFMQATSENFGRVDRQIAELQERVTDISADVNHVNDEVQDLKGASCRHELQLNETIELAKSTHAEQNNIHTDINKILHRLTGPQKKVAKRQDIPLQSG
ncbi:MAG TPA: hypothetical protein VJ836_03850 [Candidatus Saccharimonadales bacterium]|nr:hypothetical protein [Candidatus Saccharimonadales bacterium]